MSEWEIVSLSCAPSPCYKANCAPLILRNFIAVIMNCWAIQETNVAAPKTDALTHMAMPIAAHVYGVMPISTLYTQKQNNDMLSRTLSSINILQKISQTFRGESRSTKP